MVARAGEFVVVAVLGAAAVLGPAARGQGPSAGLPPAPVPVAPGVAAPPSPAVALPGHLDPAAPVYGADLPYVVHPPPGSPSHPADPGRDGWGPYGPPSPDPAVFFDVDLQVLRPVL